MDYVQGFMDTTGLSEYDANDQLCAMSHDMGSTYADGERDGLAYLAVFPDGILIHPDSGHWQRESAWRAEAEDYTDDGGPSIDEQIATFISYDPNVDVLHADGTATIKEEEA